MCLSESMIYSFIVRFLCCFRFPLQNGKSCGKTLNLVSLVLSSLENGLGGGRPLLIEENKLGSYLVKGGNVKQVYTRCCCGSSPVEIAFVTPVPVLFLEKHLYQLRYRWISGECDRFDLQISLLSEEICRLYFSLLGMK